LQRSFFELQSAFAGLLKDSLSAAASASASSSAGFSAGAGAAESKASNFSV
jgi:hypothetical protein